MIQDDAEAARHLIGMVPDTLYYFFTIVKIRDHKIHDREILDIKNLPV